MKFKRIINLLLVVTFVVNGFYACKSVGAMNTEATTYVGLRINPEIELIANKNGYVITANAINEDGEIVLSNISLEGESIEKATEIFTETANELGYFTPNGDKDTVYIDVESSVEGEDSKIKEKINKNLSKYFNNKGINGKISPETLEKYIEKATYWNIPVGHAKLVMRVLDENPELTDTEVLELSIKDIMKMLKGEKVAVGLKEEYREEVSNLKEKYSRMFEICTEIKELKAQLETEITEEERIEIERQIEEKENEKKNLKDAYKNELEELKKSYHNSSKELRKQYGKQAENKKNNNKK